MGYADLWWRPVMLLAGGGLPALDASVTAVESAPPVFSVSGALAIVGGGRAWRRLAGVAVIAALAGALSPLVPSASGAVLMGIVAAVGPGPSTLVVAKCYRRGMAVNMHIRELDEPTHRELVRRAEAAGMSLRAYVVEVLQRHAALPTLEEWLDEVRGDPPLPSNGPDSVTLVEEGRRDTDVA